METEIHTIDGTPTRGLWPVTEEPQRDVEQVPEITRPRHRPAATTILDEFVSLLRDNPKVWAVNGTEDPPGITVWTYIDSDDRRDRSQVYAAEWQLMTRFPEVAFDFNVLLKPAGSEQFEAGTSNYFYIR